MDVINKIFAASALGIATVVALPFVGMAALDAVALVPTTVNVDHLNDVAASEWEDEGYEYIRTVEEKATGAGLFSGYDLRVGGGRIICELRDQETGETKYGSMSYDTAGFLNRHVYDEAPESIQAPTPSTTNNTAAPRLSL